MSLLDETIWGGIPGESDRLDHIIKEHEKLERRFAALVQLLADKQVLSPDDVEHLRRERATDLHPDPTMETPGR